MKTHPLTPGTHATLGPNHEFIPATDLIEWAEWFEKADRRVDETFVGAVRISTVFLGVNHYYGEPTKKGLWFETMIFGGDFDDDQWRYETWDEAVRGHALAVDIVKNVKCPDNEELGKHLDVEIAPEI